MFWKTKKKSAGTRPAPRRAASAILIEAVEPRTLMSASTVMSPDAIYVRSASVTASATSDTPYSSDDGYTPAEIRTAYGFSSATFSSGTVAADGSGQTIAIIDAYNDPNIRSDLSVFDAQFDIAAPPSFDVVNQTGGTNLPTTNAGWAGEIALDVEWAHAIAPAASILLVEASSDNTPDLMAAVNYARSASGVSVVSMSWGGSEFESSYDGGESSTQTTYDADFTTPAGHRGVTFVSAAGDSGQQNGVQWPASSSNVLSVGGTSLTTEADGTYVSESGWSGTSSGYSQVEAEPAYQDVTVNPTGYRSVSDVSYDADPNTGFAVYDSVADTSDNTTYAGWQEVGGTSAGSPQWSALIAIADQGRAIAGLSTLDGATQTLPDLYDLYSAPDTTGYANYTTYFNDVTSGGSGHYGGHRGGPPGSSQNSAAEGYDLITGLGTPKAAAIIDDLATSAAVTGTGGSTYSGGGTGTSSQTLSPVAVTILTMPTSAVVGGTAATVKVRLTNTASTPFAGPITVVLYTSTDATAANETATLDTVKLASVKLKANGSETLTLKFDYPDDLSGTYYLVATANATATVTEATTAATAATVTIAEPTVDLSVTFAGSTAIAVTPGKNAKAPLRITNLGNVTAKGSVTVVLTAVSSIDGTSAQVATVTRKVKIVAGKVLGLTLPFTAPADLTPGDYTLVATITSTTTPSDGNTANNTATSQTEAA